MRDVVINESTFIRALEAECTRHRDDLLSAQVIRCVLAEHRWLLTAVILGKYEHQFGVVQCHGVLANGLISQFHAILADSAKSCLLESGVLPDVTGRFDPHDAPFVNLAAYAQASMLVTNDARLIKDIVGGRIDERNGFDIVHGRDAAARLECV
jgi:hypothetical protein